MATADKEEKPYLISASRYSTEGRPSELRKTNTANSPMLKSSSPMLKSNSPMLPRPNKTTTKTHGIVPIPRVPLSKNQSTSNKM